MSVTILVGDVFARLAEIPDDSVDCVFTSPPYWGLRDYGTATWEGGDPACDHRSPTMREGRDEQRAALAGSKATNSAQLLLAHRAGCGKCGAVKVDAQIGLEPTLGQHLEVMVAVFEEIRRVLKPTGTCWINYGDCYATSPNGRSAADTKAAGTDDRTFRDKPFSTIGPIYVPDPRDADRRGNCSTLQGAPPPPSPGRVAAGGYLKAKDLCMVPNRLAIALQEAGWWVRSEIIWAKPNPMPESIKDRPATAHEKIFLLTKSPRYFYAADEVRKGRTSDEDANTFRGGSYVGGEPGPRQVTGNKRVGRAKADSFARTSKTTAGDHGQKPQHRPDREEVAYLRGNGRNLRNYEPAPVQVWEVATASFSDAHFATFPPELVRRGLLAGCPKGGTVLDPFGGAGTTALVADRLGLDATIIELNPEYAEIARKRIESEQGMFSNVEVAA